MALHGPPVAELVPAPTWDELRDGLRSELASIERELGGGREDPPYDAYAVANGCRVIYSLSTHDVVVTKRAALAWASSEVAHWRPSAEAARRVYDGEESESDAAILRGAVGEIVATARERLISVAGRRSTH